MDDEEFDRLVRKLIEQVRRHLIAQHGTTNCELGDAALRVEGELHFRPFDRRRKSNPPDPILRLGNPFGC